MRLSVNLVPALAYALVTMFAHMAGLSTAQEQPVAPRSVVSVPVCQQVLDIRHSRVLVASNGRLTLSNGFGEANLVWQIPFVADTKLVN